MSLTQEYYSRVIESEKLSCFWETSVYSHLWTIKRSMRKAADLNIMQQTHLFPRVEFCWVQIAYQANWNLVTTHTGGKWLVSADRGVNTTGKRIYAILRVQKPIWASDTCVCSYRIISIQVKAFMLLAMWGESISRCFISHSVSERAAIGSLEEFWELKLLLICSCWVKIACVALSDTATGV